MLIIITMSRIDTIVGVCDIDKGLNNFNFPQRLTQQTIQLDCYKFRFHFIIFCYNLVVDVIIVGWNGVHLLKCSIVNVISVVSHFEATVYFHGTVGFFEVWIKIAEAHWLEV